MKYNYKIVVDSCCELPEELRDDERFERVPLEIEVGDDYRILDDENFNQKDFLRRVAECPKCPKSSCPSPESYMNAYRTEAERVYVVTLTSKLSGSYNSAVLGKNLYEEQYGDKNILVVDSRSASCGETQIALKLMELEEQGLTFAEITKKIRHFRNEMHTYFVLDNLETLRKNGRLTGIKAVVASTLTDADKKRIIISHCNAPDRALLVEQMIKLKTGCNNIMMQDMAGISSMYANDGGVIVAV